MPPGGVGAPVRWAAPVRRTRVPWIGRAIVAVLIVAASTLALAPRALGHASLIQTRPGGDAVISRSPARVTLRFSEAVDVPPGGLRVVDPDARRVDTGPALRPAPEAAAVALPPDLPRGSYTATWRVVSADGHPVSGAFVFSVGAPGAAAAVAAPETPRAVDAGFTAVRALAFALVLVIAGGVAVLALALGGLDPPRRDRLTRGLGALAVVLCLVSVLGLVLQAATAEGVGPGRALTGGAVERAATGGVGVAWIVQAALALALGALLLLGRRIPAARWIAVAAAALLVVLPGAQGHARAAGPLAWAADGAHVAAAAAWTGGLAVLMLGLLLAGAARWGLAGRAVPRFSALALGAVGVLVLAGAARAYQELGAVSDLWRTTYGWLVLAKIALVIVLIAVGAHHRLRSVPRLRAGTDRPRERRAFMALAGAELALMAGAVGLTAVLVRQPPPDRASAAAAAVTGSPRAAGRAGPYRVLVIADPARAGANQIDVVLRDARRRKAPADEVRLAARLPAAGVGPIRIPTYPHGPGTFIAHGVRLPIPGAWRIAVDVRRGEFDLFTTTVTVAIRKER